MPKIPAKTPESSFFVKVPCALLQSASPNAILVYSGFAKFADFNTGETTVSTQTVAKFLRLNIKTIKRGLRELSANGWIATCLRGQGNSAIRKLETVPICPRLDGPDFGPQSGPCIKTPPPDDQLRCNILRFFKAQNSTCRSREIPKFHRVEKNLQTESKNII